MIESATGTWNSCNCDVSTDSNMIMYRQAILDDVDEMAEVDAVSWPKALAASPETIANRVSVFASGQWVAVLDDHIVGSAFAQRLSPHQLESQPLTYDTMTDHGTFQRTHLSTGSIYQLVSVGVGTAARRSGCGRGLIRRQIDFAQQLEGITRIVGFTRPVRFFRFPQFSIEEYLERCFTAGDVTDPVLSFHRDLGARVVSTHSGFRTDDHESRGFGVLIEYPA